MRWPWAKRSTTCRNVTSVTSHCHLPCLMFGCRARCIKGIYEEHALADSFKHISNFPPWDGKLSILFDYVWDGLNPPTGWAFWAPGVPRWLAGWCAGISWLARSNSKWAPSIRVWDRKDQMHPMSREWWILHLETASSCRRQVFFCVWEIGRCHDLWEIGNICVQEHGTAWMGEWERYSDDELSLSNGEGERERGRRRYMHIHIPIHI